MDYIICETCGFEENELGLKRCKSCGAELYYVDEAYFDDKEYQIMGEEIWRSETERVDDEEFWENVRKCMVTTGNSFEGYHITEYIDVIFDERLTGIKSETSLRSLSDILSSFAGAELRAYTKQINELKRQVKESLKQHAVFIGGNAIIAIHFETTITECGAIMVSINGTAVKIEDFR